MVEINGCTDPRRRRRSIRWIVHSSDDVTARERRDRAERDFVTNAAHELQTPIAAITSAIEVLQARREGASRGPRPLPRAHRACDRPAGAAHTCAARARARADSRRAPRQRAHRGRAAPALGRGVRSRRGRVEVACEAGHRSDREPIRCSSRHSQTSARTRSSTHRAGFCAASERGTHGRVTIAVADQGPGSMRRSAASSSSASSAARRPTARGSASGSRSSARRSRRSSGELVLDTGPERHAGFHRAPGAATVRGR